MSLSVWMAIALFWMEQIQGKLIFRNPLHEPRVYQGAPPGVHVTTVQAYEPQAGRKSVMYNLLDVRDHEYFSIDSTSGNISTSKDINKKAGDAYEIIAVAISQGETKLRQLHIAVTEFNEHPPVFEHDVYRGELHVRAKVGTNVLRVRALDADPIPYNAEVHYILEPDDQRGRFAMDPQTGVLTLARPLDASESIIEFGVVAKDGGSPMHTDMAKIEVLVKTISEPRDVRSANATGSAVHICWTRPEYGTTLGYIIKYRQVDNPHGGPSFLNITSNATSKCTTITDLKPWTDYEFRVYGWNRYETGQGSTVGRFGTRPDYCQMNICQHGECHVLNEEPGYHCDCTSGYFGEVCDKFDSCWLNPCENFGLCKNISHNKYRCDCLSGFSGQNCSDFNPCALRPSPCQNGARCESTASHKYQCYCNKGYYGKTCQFFDPCSQDPCRNGGQCNNVSQAEYICKCEPGYTGKECETDIDECASFPCKHGAICRDGINTFHCRCAPGYRGKRCHLIETCSTQTLSTNKGVFRWNTTAHGRAYLIECPFGSIFPDREGAIGYAKRRCFLLSNGSVAWGRMDLSSCREEGFKNAEDLTGELWMLTEDPRHLNVERLQEAAKQIEGVLGYAIYDKKIAHNMLSIISNMLAINESLLENGDRNGSTTNRLVDIVDKFLEEVRLDRGESITLETENVVVKAVSWDPETSDLVQDILSFSVHYQSRQRRDYVAKNKYRPAPQQSLWSEEMEDDPAALYEDTEITIPIEALLLAQNQTYQELRLKFAAYKNDKFFRSSISSQSCYNRRYTRRSRDCERRKEQLGFVGRRVLQASISNASVSNLSDPVVYVLPSPTRARVFCAFWKDHERIWSTEGIVTNQSGNSTTCLSSHLTTFSLLLDPTPGEGISLEHQYALSIISYIGSGLSMLGLTLTILTYSLFRCLNRDHPGKILLHLCVSMLLMNAVFVAGSQRGTVLAGIDICVTVAVLIHYFLLTSLAWMCVEATNMYQLLIHVFASSESHFMLKRSILAWGIPLIIVGVTVLMDWSVYHSQNEYCMLSAANPYVYYISFLGPSCLILLINLTVFIMVTKVLFTPRDVSKPAAVRHKKEKFTVTTAQVRGAFSVMVLLGVSWVFGAFAFGEARLVFQYVFCVANSLQGFLIFVVRCLQYPEARSAWYQLLKTGTFKKYRGMMPPGSWSGNSNSCNKQNGHSTNSSRLGSTDATNTVAFNSNFWNKSSAKDGSPPQYSNQDDFTSSRSAQLLTFSATLKCASHETTPGSGGEDALESRMSKSDRISLSPSESSQDVSEKLVEKDKSIRFSFGLGSPVVLEAVEGGETPRSMKPADRILQDTQLTAVSSSQPEAKIRGSFGSIGFIDDEGHHHHHLHHEKPGGASALERKIFASKASTMFTHVKSHSPPDLDKQHSWPRTVSSFMGGKEPLKGANECDGQSTLPKRFFSSSGSGHSLSECQDRHSCQIIPLQVRPSTPSTHSTFSPTRRDPLEKRDSDISLKAAYGTIHQCNVQGVMSNSGDLTPTSHLVNRIHPLHNGDTSSYPRTPRTTSLDVISDVSISGPTTHVFVPTVRDNQNLAKPNEGNRDISPDEDTFRIWERQGLVSPSKAMFIDSAASRL